MSTDLSGIVERMAAVRSSVEAARNAAGRSDEVTIVAVTKTMPAETIRAAYSAGQRVFGENRVQEAIAKMDALSDELPDARWHLIGHLQSNKARLAVRSFSLIESVDSVKLARVLDSMASSESGGPLPILLEVNVAAEASKHGFLVEELPEVLPAICELSHLQLRGLMTVAPLVADPEDVRSVFRRLRELRDSLREHHDLPGLTELSMGMSGDYPVAVQEGATMVRIGRAIFGERTVDRVERDRR